MSKLIDEPVDIPDNHDKLPTRFGWHRHWYKVRNIIEQWSDTGRWWEGESEKIFYRLQTTEDGVYELYHDLRQNQWRLYRVLD